MLGGHSGTGKSSLINCINPELNLKTAEISNQYLQGKHTTTHAEMFDLNYGAKIILYDPTKESREDIGEKIANANFSLYDNGLNPMNIGAK